MGKNNADNKNWPQGGVEFSSKLFKHVSDDTIEADAQEGHGFSSKSFRYVNEGISQDDEDSDTATFIELSQELREEGDMFFQQREYFGALLNYTKAIKLLPENHEDVAILRTNMAACYMEMGVNEYSSRAINECNSALQEVPRFSKALLKRARCYMDINRFDLALMDIDAVLECEPDNIIALNFRDSLINQIVQLEAEIEDEEAATKKTKTRRRSRKKKKKNEKANGEGGEAANGDVQDQAVLEQDETVTKQNNIANIAENKEQEIEKRKVQIKNEKAEISTKTTNDKEVGTRKKIEPRTAKNGRATVDKRAVIDKEKKFQSRRFVKEEAAKTERRDIMNKDDKKVELRMILNEAKKAETMMLKFVYGEDIRCAVLPLNSNIFMLRDKVKNRFRTLKGVIMKYKDHEDDLITITTTEDLRMAETYIDPTGCLRLYITWVDYDAEPVYGDEDEAEEIGKLEIVKEENSESKVEPETSKDHWIGQFARVLKNHVGFNSDSNLELHEAGMKLYSDAMEQTVTSDEADSLLENAAWKFQEMAALASYNLGNVYMTKAKKKFTISDDDSSSRESVLEQAKIAFKWAQKQYENARMAYGLAVKIKPDFYEGFIALGYQQLEQARLTWYYALANDFDIESHTSLYILDLYNTAEETIEKGVLLWEKLQQKHPQNSNRRPEADSLGKIGHLRTLSTDEFANPASIMRSQIYVLWGALLYERSVVEYKMGIPVWAECLEVAVEKFELAGASRIDIAVMVKNHCSNVNAFEGLEFKIEEMVQAWNEMHDGKRWQFCEPSFRLEPLFRRQGPKLVEIFEHIGCSVTSF